MHIKSKLGYAWAALGIPIMLFFFLGMGFWMKLLFIDPGVKYSERISGGDGTVDFRLELNTVDNKVLLIPYTGTVKALSDENVMTLEKQRTVRVNLVKEDI